MRIDSPTNIRVTSDLSGSFSGSFSGDGSNIKRIDTANITVLNGAAGNSFTEQVQDIAGGLIGQADSNGIQATYNDGTNQFAIENTAVKFKNVLCSANGGTFTGTGAPIIANGIADTLNIEAGNDINLTVDANNKIIKITGTSAPNNNTITLSAGTGLSGGGAFTVDQSFNEQITFNIDSTVVTTGNTQTMSGQKTFSNANTYFNGNIRALGNIVGDGATIISNINTIECNRIFGYDDDEDNFIDIGVTADTQTFTTGATEILRLNNTGAYFNRNGDASRDFKIATDTQTEFFCIDSGLQICQVGSYNSRNTAKRAELEVYNVDTTGITDTDGVIHNILCINEKRDDLEAYKGGSIAFTGPGDDGTSGTQPFYGHAWICGVQTSGTNNFVGLDFGGHNSSTATNNTQINMRLKHDGDLLVRGDVIAYSTALSDERLKKNIAPLTNSLDTICKLNGKTFEWKSDQQPGTYIGLIAQEVQEVVPDIIKMHTAPFHTHENDFTEYLTIQYEQLIPHLIESIKELRSEVNELRSRLGDS